MQFLIQSDFKTNFLLFNVEIFPTRKFATRLFGTMVDEIFLRQLSLALVMGNKAPRSAIALIHLPAFVDTLFDRTAVYRNNVGS